MAKILAFIPAYRCERQIPRVIAQFTPEVRALFDLVVVIDNRSPDGTAEAARDALSALGPNGWLVLRNRENYGLGGSHKVAFQYAFDHGFSHLAVLHGDDQGDIADLAPLIRSGEFERWDALLGGRFMRGSRLPGYSRLRTVLNRVANLLFSAVSMRRISDLGAGLNMYRVEAFADRTFLNFADTLNFNQVLLLHSVAAGHRMRFFPLTWREDDQLSNARMFSLGSRMLRILLAYVIDRRGLFAGRGLSRPAGGYRFDVVAGGAP